MLEAELMAVGKRILECEHFGPGMTMDSLPEWTSLKHVLLLGEIAERFKVPIEIEDAYRLDSFSRLLAHIASHVAPLQKGYEYDNIGALLCARSRELGDSSFLIFPKEKINYTYAATHRIASVALRTLEREGLRNGDRFCLVFPNGPEFLLYYFAAHLLGLILVPINPTLAPEEMRFIIENCGSRLALFHRDLTKSQLAVEKLLPGASRLAAPGSGFEREALEAAASDVTAEATDRGLDDDAVILYTSGTTGKPKGVVLSHRNFLADAEALVTWFNFKQRTRTLCLLPMFHNNGQVITLLSPMLVGGDTVIVDGKSALSSFWKLVFDYQVQWTSVMPAFLAALLEFRLDRRDASLLGVICGGQVLLDEIRARFEAEYHVPIFEGFGLTETTSFSSMNAYPAEKRRFGSIGRALPCNKMKIVRDDGTDAAAEETGQILILGDNVARRYHNLPELTNERFVDGWLQTGDYGHRDTEGNFYFATRLDDLIIKGGENIYPSEIENILHANDDVVECAAFGIPDPILGQDVCVYVKTRDSASVSSADLSHYLRGKIAQFKQPRHIVMLNDLTDMAELPKGPTRKILRGKLQEHFAALH